MNGEQEKKLQDQTPYMHAYVRRVCGIFSRGISIGAFMYGAYIQFWPTKLFMRGALGNQSVFPEALVLWVLHLCIKSSCKHFPTQCGAKGKRATYAGWSSIDSVVRVAQSAASTSSNCSCYMCVVQRANAAR